MPPTRREHRGRTRATTARAAASSPGGLVARAARAVAGPDGGRITGEGA
ncbi:hypothetical protein [Streptomyces sp. NPDC046685]